MIPVHMLNPDEALAELERLLDLKVEAGDDPAALGSWKREHGQRATDLQAWCMMHRTKDQNPSKEEAEMPPKPKPISDKVSRLVQKYREACDLISGAKNKLAADQIRNRAHGHKFEINRLCREGGFSVPELPDLPGNPFAKHKGGPGVPPKPAQEAVDPKPVPPAAQDGTRDVQVHLPRELWAQVEAEAKRRGITPEALIKASVYLRLAEGLLTPPSAA